MALMVAPFERAAIVNVFGNSAVPQQRPAVEYLFSYLSDLSATAILVEARYVDRHYLDDFAHYYSRSFNPPPAQCGRMHFFRGLSPQELLDKVNGAYASPEARRSAQEELHDKYLGFVVRRPLPGATIGRTVLATYEGDDQRHYQATRNYVVNICGLRLRVDGLAFQEQDGGAAVCASTALWSALQRVAHVSGHRSPTPISITKAAASPFPASDGLFDPQMAAALSTLGYVAEYFAPAENRTLFRAQIASCLQSRLPVVLMISKRMRTGAGEIPVGHAIALTGYREPTTVIDVPMMFENIPPVRMKSGALGIVYAHDDNLGSHARYEFFDDDSALGPDGYLPLKLRRGKKDDTKHSWWTADEWTVNAALVPKPDKLRLPVKTLLSDLVYVRHFVGLALSGVDLWYATRFSSGVEYRDELFKIGVDHGQLGAFQQTVDLPRHIGVLTAHSEAGHLLDVIIDVTEVQRDPTAPRILGVVAPGVPRLSLGAKNLQQVFSRVALITGG